MLSRGARSEMNQGETRKTGEAEIRPPVLGDKAEGSEALDEGLDLGGRQKSLRDKLE